MRAWTASADLGIVRMNQTTRVRGMEPEREVTLWPSRENYSRFRSVCDDEVPETFDEFEAIADQRLLHIRDTFGILIEKVAFDPDQMALWCRTHFGEVNAEARRAYAGFISLSD
jgi:hypothetical protein